ncbi:MAG: type II toxin-antitoxin system VapC family toxin, partial [Candidatus Micrarchaeota archaeon]|nr:type II toxin-antitoxin system VapC family toxin [Candidatus Micrarchaeota archaeon]MDE1859953.1 type II toxin-antitoxin system VapC family toxin [Candidatus Micrarchaeota archaeon]
MKVSLDSSAIIEFLKGNKKVNGAITSADELYTRSTCAYEVLLGEEFEQAKGIHFAYRSTVKFFESILTLQFTYDDSIKAAKIATGLMLKGRKVDDFDVLIAAQALSSAATLLTKMHSRKPTISNRGMNANGLQFDRS